MTLCHVHRRHASCDPNDPITAGTIKRRRWERGLFTQWNKESRARGNSFIGDETCIRTGAVIRVRRAARSVVASRANSRWLRDRPVWSAVPRATGGRQSKHSMIQGGSSARPVVVLLVTESFHFSFLCISLRVAHVRESVQFL